MKIATVRQVRHDFGTVLDWIQDGQKVEIRKRGKIVALLTPPTAPSRQRRRRPDLSARLRMRDGNRVVSRDVMDEILQFNKGGD